ncbi:MULTISPECIES: ArsA family ATPase [Streptomyces]|uniref:ArsA family ATPase n=1 Tax=Streptomyces glycanivorans TaxID=3033808 RepID=A0ABY9JCW6_9ACTN|nr:MULTISPECIES: ArsA family ATPase [unclassified Streptomyces]WSQ79032.1 ArsA family ATPase [Streptomyces sp. NBC_01213]TXS17263.1 ArsA family ATPase [Streptomyces sp. wa22]WLQ65617.1 ArsA family ATPase [Streptomyces sp. Alt3]WSQ86401.1 ArsA family ATPase [Streptomyces sp. NBC_01212]WSR49695.1 ArsA family ATPase [Streptomyces sp. NBC_01201]
MTRITDVSPGLETDALLDDPGIRIVVCCGSGGVGKTTTAAALGVRAAERGRKVVVLTIDPARRLAQSMGIDRLDNVPRRVEGIEGDGELHAMMLDMKRTFDETVEAHTDAERARAILENPFYQSLSAGFAGTQEYMAMEKLGQLRARDEWDLIVVDTPPSRSALDFLDAPKRLGSFLDGKFIRLLIAPAKIGGRAGMKFLNVGMSMMTGTLGKLLGGQFLRDVQTFVAAMDSMFGGFRTRADATYKLLQAPGTAFLVVATPERDALREAAYFVERLAAEKMPLAGLVLNRVHGSDASRLSEEQALTAAENLEAVGIVDQATGKAGLGDPADPAAATSPEAPQSPPSPERSNDPAPHEPPQQEPPSHDRTSRSPEPHSPGRKSTDPSVPLAQTEADRQDTPVTDDVSTEVSVEQLTAGLLRLHAERMQVVARELHTRDRFTAHHPEVPVTEVAALPGDVHDLSGLRAVGELLATGSAPA